MICIVIPYFQRQPGILAKALRSVFASQGVSEVHIVVVDDQSPVPAKQELATFDTLRFPVTLIEQANTGPGGARNTGLENVPKGTEYVAFLDSDDEWSPQHLENALVALRAGSQVYFADHLQLGAEVSAFRRAGRLDPSRHKNIAERRVLHAYEGNMFDQIVTGNVIGTSTVVFDYMMFPDVRFRTDLATAGEDYLFWLELSHRGAAFGFGENIDAVYGKGVNIYAGSGWGTEGHARRVLDELMFKRMLTSLYALTPNQRTVVLAAIKKLQDDFVVDLLHRAAHRKRIDWNLTRSAVLAEPGIMLRVLPKFVEQLYRSLRTRIKLP